MLQSLLADRQILAEQEKTRSRRHEASKKWHTWLSSANTMEKMSDAELKTKFLEYFESADERHPFNAIYRDRIIRNPEKFRRMLRFLLDDTIDIKVRIEKILNKKGEHYIEGVGKGLATSFLMDHDPTKYCLWNNKVNMGLEALGWLPAKIKGELISDTYMKILDVSKHLMELSPEPCNNLIDVDHFYHIVAVTPVGKVALAKIKGLPSEEITAEREAVSAQFGMEKGLEDFIHENFKGVFPNLTLYEDEESNGRQYPTDVGPIDFLAEENNSKNLVVIELKRWTSPDSAVGQILRYMQWVEENLLEEGGRVRGVIIAKEQDEKLKYALKRIADVDFYSYWVQFEVKKAPK